MDSLYIADKTLSELVSLFNCEIENDDDFYDVVAYNICKSNYKYLVKNFESFDSKRKRAAIFGLRFIKHPPENLLNKLMSYLNCDALIVSEVIDSLACLDRGKNWEVIEPLLTHDSEFVRGAALRYARISLKQKSIGILTSALKDEHQVVRQNAIDELSELGNPSIIDTIKPFLKDKSPEVRKAAESAIEQLLA